MTKIVKICLLILYCCSYLSPFARETYHFTSESEIYVTSEIKGTLTDIQTVLKSFGLIDQHNSWSGGKKHFVSLGDIIHSNSSSKIIIEYYMQLQTQAKQAGGGFHILLGDHELKSLRGEWHDLSVDEITIFADDESEQLRLDAYQRYIRWNKLEHNDERLDKFNNDYPEGLFARLGAFSQKGKYGQWLQELPFIIRINDQVFTHGGLSHKIQNIELESINRQLRAELKSYLQNYDYFLDKGQLYFDIPFKQRKAYIKKLEDSRQKDDFLSSHKSLAFSRFGPSWYRGNSLCHSYFEEDIVTGQLQKWDASRLWVGHIRTQKSTVQSRFSGQLMMMDAKVIDPSLPYHSWVARIDNNHQVSFINSLTSQTASAEPMINREFRNPYHMSDEQLENFLLTAQITNKENTKEGRTKPYKLTLEKDGVKMFGIFKYKDSKPFTHKGSWSSTKEKADRYHYEVAAYKLDRILDIGLVPVTVERNIDGRNGIIQVWIDGLISDLAMREKKVAYKGFCDPFAQVNMMDTFDYLIANKDRNQTNIMFSENDWQIWFIDHSRAFSAKTKRNKALKKLTIQPTQAFKHALKSLTIEQLDELRAWLHHRQVDAIWRRKNNLIKGKF